MLGATVSPTVPAAVPFCPDDTAIHGAVVAALQEQPAIVVTSTLRCPPAAPIESRVRLSSNTQDAPAWVSGTLSAPTTIAPDRAAGTGFGATVYATTACPCPLWSPVIATHEASVAIDQVQSRAVEIVTEPGPPPDPNAAGVLAASTWHLSDEGARLDVDAEVQDASRRAHATAAPPAEPQRRRIGSIACADARTSPVGLANG